MTCLKIAELLGPRIGAVRDGGFLRLLAESANRLSHARHALRLAALTLRLTRLRVAGRLPLLLADRSAVLVQRLSVEVQARGGTLAFVALAWNMALGACFAF